MFDAEADRVFYPAEIKEISNPKSNRRLYSYGTIKYKDVFGRKHFTNFCLILEPTTNNPDRSTRTRVNASKHHNDST
jgi:hypothetical protein